MDLVTLVKLLTITALGVISFFVVAAAIDMLILIKEEEQRILGEKRTQEHDLH